GSDVCSSDLPGPLRAQAGEDTLLECLAARAEERPQGRVGPRLGDETGAQVDVVAQGMLHLAAPVFIELAGEIRFEMLRVHGVRRVRASPEGGPLVCVRCSVAGRC